MKDRDKKGKRIECALGSFSAVYFLMHLTQGNKVSVMLDEFTGHVTALVTCATL